MKPTERSWRQGLAEYAVTDIGLKGATITPGGRADRLLDLVNDAGGIRQDGAGEAGTVNKLLGRGNKVVGILDRRGEFGIRPSLETARGDSGLRTFSAASSSIARKVGPGSRMMDPVTRTTESSVISAEYRSASPSMSAISLAISDRWAPRSRAACCSGVGVVPLDTSFR